eukprot:TRINITY_DN411_c0_g1_i1.p1 TRINITY_DN411_c0_g1~~TRINITY_DN411_c0_g1_i1.p1  ORF type:complete len:104 (+),score=9.28 TRINITY_DN411_c0_g1_i1:51-362(+)
MCIRDSYKSGGFRDEVNCFRDHADNLSAGPCDTFAGSASINSHDYYWGPYTGWCTTLIASVLATLSVVFFVMAHKSLASNSSPSAFDDTDGISDVMWDEQSED